MFSQFTKFLSAIEPHLKNAGICYVRFDGSMSAKKRADVIHNFQNPAKIYEDAYDSSATEYSDSDTEEEPSSLQRKNKGVSNLSMSLSRRKEKGKGRESGGAPDLGPTVMLISLKSGSVGINLTAAQVCSRLKATDTMLRIA